MANPRVPLLPADVLDAHYVNQPHDTRFRAAARMLQSLWRVQQGLAAGTYEATGGPTRPLGSRLTQEDAKAGANFFSDPVYRVARWEAAYREPGALFDLDRLYGNLLSSQALSFNLFGPLRINPELGNAVFRRLLPAFFHEFHYITFEHSPGRGNPRWTADPTAFDVFVPCITVNGQEGFVAFEVKYSENMQESPAPINARHGEIAVSSGLFVDPAANELRSNPLQQLWREHLLSRAMLDAGPYDDGMFVVVAPAANAHCHTAIEAYQQHLRQPEPGASGFHQITLDAFVQAIADVGETGVASWLRDRYLDFGRLDAFI